MTNYENKDSKISKTYKTNNSHHTNNTSTLLHTINHNTTTKPPHNINKESTMSIPLSSRSTPLIQKHTQYTHIYYTDYFKVKITHKNMTKY